MKDGGREAKQGMPPLIIGSLVLVLEMGMVVVRMVLDCGDDDDEKKKVVGSWFVLLQVCTIGCAVQSCYVTIFENCDQTDHPVCAQRSRNAQNQVDGIDICILIESPSFPQVK